MRQKSYSAALVFLGILVMITGLLLLRAFFLQIIQQGRYRSLSQKNILRLIPHRAARGKIYDRFGQILAYSQPTFALSLVPNSTTKKDELAWFLSTALKMPVEEITPYLEPTGPPPLEEVVKGNLTRQELIGLEENRWAFPEIQIHSEARRLYPRGALAAHVLGYVGKITPEELAASKEKGLDIFDVVGKSGLELFYDERLRGQNGGQQIQVDAQGRPIKIFGEVAAQPGEDIYLTIDSRLQEEAEGALGKQAGSIICLNPQNGQILAMVSRPSFDPNIFVEPLTAEEWRRQYSGRYPFHNRSLNPCPPGSIFKIVTAAAALEKHHLTPASTFYCPGYFQLGNRKAKCWKAHGSIDFLRAIIESCDATFYQVGLKVGVDALADYAKLFGLGRKTGVDLPYERGGLVPSRDWKEKVWHQSWWPGDTINLAIGQGFLQASPLQTADIIAACATGGKIYKPHLVKEIKNTAGETVLVNQPEVVFQINLNQATWQTIREGLFRAVEEGTGTAAKVENLDVAGKTGTAEDPPRTSPHAWFGCYAPVADPQLVVLVFVEQGGSGGAVAAPIAGQILKWWKDNRLFGQTAETTSGEIKNIGTQTVLPTAVKAGKNKR